eukprot:9639187-Alexandrium_andersonii.AAC.1
MRQPGVVRRGGSPPPRKGCPRRKRQSGVSRCGGSTPGSASLATTKNAFCREQGFDASTRNRSPRGSCLLYTSPSPRD